MLSMDEAESVDGNEFIDLALERRDEELLHAAQIAEPFLADVGDEGDGPGSLDVRFVEGADDAQHQRKTAAIVADSRPFEDVAIHV